MPEFVLEGRDHAARTESDFVLGFIEAMFFTNCEPSVDRADWFTKANKKRRREGQISELPGDVGYLDLSPATLTDIRHFCIEWQEEHAELLATAYAHPIGYTEVQAGRDLWFSMQGHGVGFWDRDLGEVGDQLHEAAGHVDTTPYYETPFVHLEI